MKHPAELAGHLRMGDATDPEGVKVPQAAGMGAQVTPSTLPGLGDPACCKHLLQGPETAKTSSHVYIKPSVKVSQQIPSIDSAPLAIQRDLIKVNLQGTDRQL